MNLFEVTVAETGEDLCVAARTMDHAAETFVTFWVARTGSAPGEFHIGRGAPLVYAGHPTVEIAASGDVAGVVVLQQDGFMLFEAAIS
jgi:hypothetical protein